MGPGKDRTKRSFARKGQKMVTRNDKMLQEIKKIEAVEYGIKEFLHGLLIGIIIGFFIAMFLLK